VSTPHRCPDIYYVILDGYGRADVLEEVYHHDNSGFLDDLAQRGFFVASKSRSNYCQSLLSLASSLNLTYLDDLASQAGVESDNRRPLIRMVRDSQVVRFLKQYGYRFVTFASGYTGTEIREADIYVTPRWTLSDFQNVLILTTPVPMMLRGWQYDVHRDRISYTFEHVASVTEMASPNFILVHIVAPHPPFVFDEKGGAIHPNRIFTLGDGNHYTGWSSREEYVASYRGQLIYVNRKIEEMVDAIISNSPEPPVIILQADHGPGSMLDWRDPDKTNFKERMSIFNAYYLPGGNEQLYEEITPVNTFRVILNKYFGTDLELLADRSYFSTWTRPYQFIRYE